MGVAFVVLLSGSLGGVALSKLGFMGEIALSIAAVIGSLSVMALIVYVSQKVKGNVTLLIIGVMIGYVANAVIGVLKFFSVEEDIRAYVIWGLGSFARVSGNQMTLFAILMTILIPLSFLLIKTMNLMLLGIATHAIWDLISSGPVCWLSPRPGSLRRLSRLIADLLSSWG